MARAQQDELLATLEAATLGAMRAALPGFLTAVLQEGTTGLPPDAVGRTQRYPGCGERWPVQSWRVHGNDDLRDH